MRTLRRVGGLATALVLGALLAAGCGSSTGPPAVISEPSPTRSGPFQGVRLNQPVEMPAVTLTDSSAKPYDLRRGLLGKVTLVFFGYTHCPDVCPTTMADIAAALRMLTPAERARVQVLFVGVDTYRDNPPALRKFLDNFDRSFVGLTGPQETIRRVATACHAAYEIPANRTGNYPVDHSAQTMVFSPDGKAHLMFTYGTVPAIMAHDLRVIISGQATP